MNAGMDVAWAIWVGIAVTVLILSSDWWANRAERRRQAQQRAEAERARVRPGEYEPDEWWW